MKQILLILRTEEEVRYALIPKDEFYDYERCPINLEEINNRDIHEGEYPRHSKRIIMDLFARTGLAGLKREDNKKDLEQYLNPKLPITIDEICYIGWTI